VAFALLGYEGLEGSDVWGNKALLGYSFVTVGVA
jgi:hypothetical protein